MRPHDGRVLKFIFTPSGVVARTRHYTRSHGSWVVLEGS